MAKKLMDFPAATQQGRESYLSGIRSREAAQLANPFKGFGGDLIEHSKFVCWNRGWNSMKKWSESQSGLSRRSLIADEFSARR